MSFTNRVFGFAVVRSINSNYNADFTHQPRTLPDGTAYATDKAFKYTVRHYLNTYFDNEKVFYFKRFNQNFNPHTLDETYKEVFGSEPQKDGKMEVLKNLLSCIDVRLFGATYAGKPSKVNVSIHGPLQIEHGVNRFPENIIYSEQIMSPFRNPGEEGEAEGGASTLGTQSKLKEGHYVHPFSLNPANLNPLYNLVGDEVAKLDSADIEKLKEAMMRGATAYDSSSMSGTNNEMMLWIQLKDGSRKTLPGLLDRVNIERNDENVIIDLEGVTTAISGIQEEVEKIEIYIDPELVALENQPDSAEIKPLN